MLLAPPDGDGSRQEKEAEEEEEEDNRLPWICQIEELYLSASKLKQHHVSEPPTGIQSNFTEHTAIVITNPGCTFFKYYFILIIV